MVQLKSHIWNIYFTSQTCIYILVSPEQLGLPWCSVQFTGGVSIAGSPALPRSTLPHVATGMGSLLFSLPLVSASWGHQYRWGHQNPIAVQFATSICILGSPVQMGSPEPIAVQFATSICILGSPVQMGSPEPIAVQFSHGIWHPGVILQQIKSCSTVLGPPIACSDADLLVI